MSRKDLRRVTLVCPQTSRRQFLQASAGVLGAASLGGVLAACGGGSSGESTAPATADQATSQATVAEAPTEVQDVSFQLRWLKDVAWAGYYAAIDKGYYEEEGLEVDILAGGPNIDVQQVVSGGGSPIGLGITDRIIRGRIEGVPLRVIGAQYQIPPASFISFAKENITQAADLAGKRIATTPEGVPLIKALFVNNGLDPDDWEFVNSGFDPSPLVEGAADIFQGFCTDQALLLEREGNDMHCLTYDVLGYDLYDAPIVTTDDTLENDEEMLVGFLRASIKGWEYNEANPDEMAELTVSKYGVEGLDLEFQKAQNLAQMPFVQPDVAEGQGLFWMTEDRWQNTIDFLVEADAIAEAIPAADVMTTAILEKAYGGKTRLLDS